MNKYRKGFTLSETLITLTILGVVAALTVPNLIHKFQDRIAITRLKKAFSTLNDAILQAQVINGDSRNWNYSNENKSEVFASYVFPYLKNAHVCNAQNADDFCYSYEGLLRSNKTLNGKQSGGGLGGSWRAAVLSDGVYYFFNIGSYYENANRRVSQLGTVFIDINGKKEPNRYGYDRFIFYVTPNNGLLTGAKLLSHDPRTGSAPLHKDNCYNDKDDDNPYNGYSCGNWIIKHNNMDYKYRDVRDEW